MKKILIVCSANKIRSVIAMEVANRIAKVKHKDYLFESAGLAVIGNELDINTRRVLIEYGVETSHVPTHIEKVNIESYDEIHVMNERQKTTICSFYSNLNLEGKITVLNIEDPFSKGIDAYRQCKEKLATFYNNFIV